MYFSFFQIAHLETKLFGGMFLNLVVSSWLPPLGFNARKEKAQGFSVPPGWQHWSFSKVSAGMTVESGREDGNEAETIAPPSVI